MKNFSRTKQSCGRRIQEDLLQSLRDYERSENRNRARSVSALALLRSPRKAAFIEQFGRVEAIRYGVFGNRRSAAVKCR
jgi:hypothetical protein